jgi:hypothetical protein
MLSIEYGHKWARVFWFELGVIAVACLGIMRMVWQLPAGLRILK